MAFSVVNPATGERLREYPEAKPREVRAAIEGAHAAFLRWRRTSFAERAAPMREAARALRARAGEFAVLMAEEMGKPVRDGRAEVEKCAWNCEFYAEHAERFLAPSPSRPMRPGASSPTSRSASCSRSCPGTSPSGRSSASPRRR